VKRTVLIADDSATIRQALRQRLEGAGFQVHDAKDGIEAVRLAYQAQPDVIVLDLMMPRMNGYQVCRLLKADPEMRQVPVVILSMLYLFRMSAKEIVGSNIVIALIMVIPASLTHYAAGGVSWPVLILLMLGSLVGTVLGSKATMVVPERALKFVIAILIVLGAASTIVKAWVSP